MLETHRQNHHHHNHKHNHNHNHNDNHNKQQHTATQHKHTNTQTHTTNTPQTHTQTHTQTHRNTQTEAGCGFHSQEATRHRYQVCQGRCGGPLFGGLVLFLLILVSVLLAGTLIITRRGHRYNGQRPSCSVVHFSSRGRARWVGGRRWPLSRRRQTSKGVSFYFPCVSFWLNKSYSFFKSMGFSNPLDMLVAKWVPTPCCNDASSVGTPKWALWGKAGKSIMRPRFPPRIGRFFLVSKRTLFSGGCMLDAPYREGQASWTWPSRYYPGSVIH